MIRPALPQDRTEWFRMRRALWPDCSPERHLLEIGQLTSDGDLSVVLVAERDSGGLCGLAEVSIRHDHVDGASSVPVGYLEGWYVDPDARARGIGRQLLDTAEKWAAARRLKELASDAELNNKGSIAALTETCRAVHFIKPIAR
jgi:aminoglycoside 6'-N-acetyltransferase I